MDTYTRATSTSSSRGSNLYFCGSRTYIALHHCAVADGDDDDDDDGAEAAAVAAAVTLLMLTVVVVAAVAAVVVMMAAAAAAAQPPQPTTTTRPLPPMTSFVGEVGLAKILKDPLSLHGSAWLHDSGPAHLHIFS